MLTDSRGIASLIVGWLILAVAVWVAAELVAGIHLEGLWSTLIVAAILGLLNLFVRPVLVILSCPLIILTLGLFLIVVNAILLGVADWIARRVDGIDFQVDSIGAAILGAIIISIVGWVLGLIIKPERF